MDKQTLNVTESRKGNAAISVAAVVVVIYGMQAAKVLLVPFLLAVFLAMVSVRPMLWLQKRRVPAFLAMLLIVVSMMLILTAIGAILGTSIAEFTAALPGYQARLNVIIEQTLQLAARFVDDGQTIENLSDLIDPGWAMGLAANLLNALRDVLTNAFLIMFTMVFILLEASAFGTKISAAFGSDNPTFLRARQFLQNLGSYLGIKTLVSIATGVTAALGTFWIGLDFPLLWGMFAFLLNYVPTIGSIIAAVPAVLLAVVQLGPAEAVSTAGLFLGINVVFGTVLEPRLMGSSLNLSGIVIMLSLAFWGAIWGVIGMVLCVPLTVVLLIVCSKFEGSRPIAVLLSANGDIGDVSVRVQEADPAATS